MCTRGYSISHRHSIFTFLSLSPSFITIPRLIGLRLSCSVWHSSLVNRFIHKGVETSGSRQILEPITVHRQCVKWNQRGHVVDGQCQPERRGVHSGAEASPRGVHGEPGAQRLSIRCPGTSWGWGVGGCLRCRHTVAISAATLLRVVVVRGSHVVVRGSFYSRTSLQ